MNIKAAIVDYGMGNLQSVLNAVEHLGYEASFVKTPQQLRNYGKVILPGVGGFGQAVDALNQSGLADGLHERKESGAQVLGICLGMQLMCSSSEEGGFHHGLNWFEAKVKKFELSQNLPIPHMGWNAVKFNREDLLFNGLDSGNDAYFVHSYHVECENNENVLASTDYGIDFTSMIQHENLRGIQFHPEKSQSFGLKMLKNFLEAGC